jgi:hypothetical protein
MLGPEGAGSLLACPAAEPVFPGVPRPLFLAGRACFGVVGTLTEVRRVTRGRPDVLPRCGIEFDS